jgi:hypothetical protein
MKLYVFVCLMVFNATFNNISVISWWSVLLVEETEYPELTTDLPQDMHTICNEGYIYTIVDVFYENEFRRTIPHRKRSLRCVMLWEIHFEQMCELVASLFVGITWSGSYNYRLLTYIIVWNILAKQINYIYCQLFQELQILPQISIQ